MEQKDDAYLLVCFSTNLQSKSKTQKTEHNLSILQITHIKYN